VIETKLLGTYRIAAIELKNPKQVYFVRNSGDFVIGINKQTGEVVVSSDLSIFGKDFLGSDFVAQKIPVN